MAIDYFTQTVYVDRRPTETVLFTGNDIDAATGTQIIEIVLAQALVRAKVGDSVTLMALTFDTGGALTSPDGTLTAISTDGLTISVQVTITTALDGLSAGTVLTPTPPIRNVDFTSTDGLVGVDLFVSALYNDATSKTEILNDVTVTNPLQLTIVSYHNDSSAIQWEYSIQLFELGPDVPAVTTARIIAENNIITPKDTRTVEVGTIGTSTVIAVLTASNSVTGADVNYYQTSNVVIDPLSPGEGAVPSIQTAVINYLHVMATGSRPHRNEFDSEGGATQRVGGSRLATVFGLVEA